MWPSHDVRHGHRHHCGQGITIHHNNFANIQQAAISYVGGGGVIVDGNTFYDSGVQTTTRTTRFCCGGTGTLQITNNLWLNQTTNKPRYGINFLGLQQVSQSVTTITLVQHSETAFLNPPPVEVIGRSSDKILL